MSLLRASFGICGVLALVDTLRERILCGEFTPNRSVQ